MDAQKRFYSKLYSRKPVDLNNEETKAFLENLNIQRLSDELNASCEGKITLQECEGILSSFQTGKTPGNDGIPVEFLKIFWSLIGKLMTDSFNEAYLKKEMSTSQKHICYSPAGGSVLGKTVGSLRSYYGDAEDNVDQKMNLYFTYESRDTLNSFCLLLLSKLSRNWIWDTAINLK